MKDSATTPAAFEWLGEQARKQLARARFTSPTGLILYYPVADGQAYPQFYLRDFVYMYESAPEFFPANEVRPVLEAVLRETRADGWAVERIAADGKPIYRAHGEGDTIDSGPFAVSLVKAYADATGEDEIARQNLDKLCRMLAVLPVEKESGLIWVDPGHSHTAYGFTDCVAKTGRELFCSALVFEALGTLEQWALRFGREERRAWCQEWRALIRKNLGLLWDEQSGMFFAASKDCRQIDVWGSIYACHARAATPEQQERVVGWLAANRNQFEYLGHIRHLPTPDYWERSIVAVAHLMKHGEFQNGAYWSTPSGWYAELLESANPGAGLQLLKELVAVFRDIGVWECIRPDGYRRINDNLSSVFLPYGAFKKIQNR
jgi:hypothetical protein